jgi:hypothetical protein
MARVRATGTAFDGHASQPDEEFDFDGAPGSWIEFLNPKDKEEGEAQASPQRSRRSAVEAPACGPSSKRRSAPKSSRRSAPRSKQKVRAEIKAKLEAAGQNDASELV